jgi:hypothetical protein
MNAFRLLGRRAHRDAEAAAGDLEPIKAIALGRRLCPQRPALRRD